MTTRDEQDIRYWLTPTGCVDGRHCRVCGTELQVAS